MQEDKKIDLSEIRDHIKWEKDGGFMSTGSLYSQDLLDAIDRVMAIPQMDPRSAESQCCVETWRECLDAVLIALGVKDAGN